MRLKPYYYTLLVLILVGILYAGNTNNEEEKFPILKGPYLNQQRPGMIPEIFAPAIISRGFHEGALVFAPGGDEVYYNITHLTHGFTAIIFMKLEDGRWTSPQVVSFSGKYNDSDAFLSFDGQRLYFSSDRPLESKGEAGNLDIWMVDRNGLSWSDPKNLGPPINSDAVDVNPCVTRNGTLYFASNRPGGRGSHDIYRSKLVNGKYSDPENLGESINTSEFESSPYVDPDESYIIFNVFVGRNTETQSGLHIAFRREDGAWTKAVNMGAIINDKRPAMFASVSYDGQFLFFTSDKVPNLPYKGSSLTYNEIIQMFEGPQNGSADIYWVSADILKKYMPN